MPANIILLIFKFLYLYILLIHFLYNEPVFELSMLFVVIALQRLRKRPPPPSPVKRQRSNPAGTTNSSSSTSLKSKTVDNTSILRLRIPKRLCRILPSVKKFNKREMKQFTKNKPEVNFILLYLWESYIYISYTYYGNLVSKFKILQEYSFKLESWENIYGSRIFEVPEDTY